MCAIFFRYVERHGPGISVAFQLLFFCQYRYRLYFLLGAGLLISFICGCFIYIFFPLENCIIPARAAAGAFS